MMYLILTLSEGEGTNCVLTDLRLSQLVNQPTHIKNHILDWVMVRSDESLITYCMMTCRNTKAYLIILQLWGT